LIVIIFLFFGTLAFFSVLFDETPIEVTEPLVTSTEFGDDNETGALQNSSSIA
jgi:hypothetical protein